MQAHGGSNGILCSFFNIGTRLGRVVNAGPSRFTPGKETRYPLYRRLEGPQGPSGPVSEISPLPRFDSLTVMMMMMMMMIVAAVIVQLVVAT